MQRFKCGNCGRESDLSPTQEASVQRAKAKGEPFVFVECPKCALSTGIYFDKLPATSSTKPKKEQMYHCPTPGCTGFAVFVTNHAPPFWGCGECGAVWREKDELFDDIDRIIKRFPYRKPCYVRGKKERWLPGAKKDEPKGYHEKVEEREPVGAGHADSAKRHRPTAKTSAKTKKEWGKS